MSLLVMILTSTHGAYPASCSSVRAKPSSLNRRLRPNDVPIVEQELHRVELIHFKSNPPYTHDHLITPHHTPNLRKLYLDAKSPAQTGFDQFSHLCILWIIWISSALTIFGLLISSYSSDPKSRPHMLEHCSLDLSGLLLTLTSMPLLDNFGSSYRILIFFNVPHTYEQLILDNDSILPRTERGEEQRA
ncbi:hypothetical protein BXZ70DRAFT_85894 [Cristinia sonorae]|uniref:Uncharacterized protein n=1 Tax=Cristinia sonorae TaxID=1940300 RepID=A0A8K0URP6_9AGAR|nr:hypothetical protein BXZ70DRAFT_85894 [Cristinia sonorae]